MFSNITNQTYCGVSVLFVYPVRCICVHFARQERLVIRSFYRLGMGNLPQQATRNKNARFRSFLYNRVVTIGKSSKIQPLCNQPF